MNCEFKKNSDKVCPFIKGGKIDFPIQPINAGLFLWPDPLPEKVGSFFIPEEYQEDHMFSTGIVLAIGPGFFSKKRNRFIPTEIKAGDRVVFDKDVLWRIPVDDLDGKEQIVWGLAEVDIKGIVQCEGCEKFCMCHS